MGSFASTMFNVLLGWLRGAAAWLWQLVTGENTSAWISWVLDHWLPLVLMLCIGGIVLDLVVYFFRWQPYRVWRRFLKREDAPDPEDESADAPQVKHRWIYADGSSVPVREETAQGPASDAAARDARQAAELGAPLRPVKRVKPAKVRRAADGSGEIRLPDLANGGDTYHEPYYPPQWTEKQEKRGGSQ